MPSCLPAMYVHACRRQYIQWKYLLASWYFIIWKHITIWMYYVNITTSAVFQRRRIVILFDKCEHTNVIAWKIWSDDLNLPCHYKIKNIFVSASEHSFLNLFNDDQYLTTETEIMMLMQNWNIFSVYYLLFCRCKITVRTYEIIRFKLNLSN